MDSLRYVKTKQARLVGLRVHPPGQVIQVSDDIARDFVRTDTGILVDSYGHPVDNDGNRLTSDDLETADNAPRNERAAQQRKTA